PGPHGVDRTEEVHDIARADVEQATARRGRRNRDDRHAAQFPEQLAVQAIRAHLARSRRDQLRAFLVLPDERGGPVTLLVAVDAPGVLARLRLERGEIRLLLVVVDDEQAVPVQGRRRGGAPAHAHLHRIELVLPQYLAVVVEAEDADVAEDGVDPLAINRRCLGGVRGFQVNRTGRLSLVDLLLPEHLAALEVETADQPAMLAGRGLPLEIVDVEALLRVAEFLLADHRGDKDAILPDNRRRPAAAGDVRLPDDVLLRAPAFGDCLRLGDAALVPAAELRPVVVRPGAGKSSQHQGDRT